MIHFVTTGRNLEFMKAITAVIIPGIIIAIVMSTTGLPGEVGVGVRGNEVSGRVGVSGVQTYATYDSLGESNRPKTDDRKQNSLLDSIADN